MQALAERLESLRNGRAYQSYLTVRDHVLRMKESEARRAGASVAKPSDYWREELENFDYMLEASPLLVAKLRHHCFHITGIRTYDYRSSMTRTRDLFAEKLHALKELDTETLFVPESPALGGFGFEIDGQLVNIDTLKFYEALLALQRGEVLRELRSPQDTKTIVEIGPGWGGFAYQLKTLSPRARIVLVDFPELFLFSGPYLMTLFPDARFAFHGDPKGGAAWDEADFVFIPNTAIDAWTPERVDLVANMASFQEMTTEQVRAYSEWAYQRNAPFLYSLNRDKSPHNQQLTSVREVLAERYWLHEIPILPVPYTKMLDRARAKPEKRPKPDDEANEPKNRFHHVVGWRRLRP